MIGDPKASTPRATSILWRRLDQPGHEAARVVFADGLWQIRGSAVFLEEGMPVCLDYSVICDDQWRTRSASVAGWVGDAEVDIRLSVTGNLDWQMNDEPQPAVRGCIDVDLNFSPSTNLLPVRRLELAVGEESLVRAAWLRFPSFRLEVLEQTYRRTGERTYEYETTTGFKAEIRVDDFGMAIDYAGGWRMETES